MHRQRDSALRSLRGAVKHGLAMLLFLGVLLGGGTAAFSLLAAGIAALSNLSASQRPVVTTASANGATAPLPNITPSGAASQSVNPAGSFGSANPAGSAGSAGSVGAANPARSAGTASAAGGAAGEAGWNPTVTPGGASAVDRLNEQISHMHSPIIGMVDSGGVTVGNELQFAFGHMLSGVIKALFLEQK